MTAHRALGDHSFDLPGSTQTCCWPHCNSASRFDLKLCHDHALKVFIRITADLDAIRAGLLPATAEDHELSQASLKSDQSLEPPRPVADDPASVAYYLRLGPVTVKIGRTVNLKARIRSLRSELQYVLATEPGGKIVERKRHLQFAAERFGTQKEDFLLSDRLWLHIDLLNVQE